MWDEITYPFPNFSGCTVEVWKWINNFTQHFMMGVIPYNPCWDSIWTTLVKRAPAGKIIYVKLALCPVMVLYGIGDRLLPETIMNQFPEAYVHMHHYVRYILPCVSKIKLILSIIFHAIYVYWTHQFPLWWLWECVLFLITIIISEVWPICHF